MTPLEIEILLHYYTTPGDYRNGNFSAPAVPEALTKLTHMDEPLLTYDPNKTPRYEITDRGSAYIQALTQVPLPMKAWVLPGCEKIIQVDFGG